MRKYTSWILIITTIGLIIWDVFVIVEPTPGDSISRVILDFSTKNPSIVLVAGILLGHLFWPQSKKD